jgi:beta-lactam-binding protein with PASTA domain/serine/threonine protein kinase
MTATTRSAGEPGRTLAGVDTTLEDPLVGREVDGRYLVESRIAHGGMANVYLALDRRLDREVALKVLYEHLSTDEEFTTRFVREARSAARLSHPNVVQVFDQGQDGAVLYLAMEYLPGRTLRDVLVQRGALTPREAISVMEPVLGALAAAHRAGIVHRDVKPENVILTDDGRIKVADFGLARAASAPMTSTSTNQLIGTVAYLAPELVSRGVADARADVYAAGILLFELLTGKQPFTGDDPLQVAYRHVHESVPAPSAIAPGLPDAYDGIVLRATDRDPDNRPIDGDAFLAELRAINSEVPDDVLDVRSVEAETLRMDPARTSLQPAVDGAPAAAGAPQATRAFSLGDEPPARGTSPLSQLVPRLRVNDDDARDGGPFRERPERFGRYAAAAAALALVLIVIGGWWLVAGPGSSTTVPDVTGKTQAVARTALIEAGLKPTIHPVYSDTVPVGSVVSTSPAADDKVKKDAEVALNVSRGPESVGVPKLAGKSLDEARQLLAGAKLDVGSTKQKYSTKVEKDHVISSSPGPGKDVKPGTAVDLVVSRGPEPVQLDNVVGQNIEQAKATLEGKGLTVDEVGQDPVEGGPAPGTVVSQEPLYNGQTVPKGSTVRLTFVKQPPQVDVPDVRGQNIDQAAGTLRGLGLEVDVQRFPPLGDQVKSQDPIGTVDAGSRVTIKNF